VLDIPTGLKTRVAEWRLPKIGPKNVAGTTL